MNLVLELPEDLRSTMSQILAGVEALQNARPRSLVTINGKAALNVARAAVALDVSEATVRKLIGDGVLKAAKAGTIYLVPAAEIERYLGLQKEEQ